MNHNGFLYLVAADRQVRAANTGALVGILTGTLLKQIKQSVDQVAIVEDGHTFAPVPANCPDDGQLTAVFFLTNDEGGFQFFTTNQSPSHVQNPA